MSADLSRERLESCAVRVEMGARATTEGILLVGQALAEARAEFGENDRGFGQWREQRLPWLSRSLALKWIQSWNRFGAEQHNNYAVNLPQTVLYLLADPSTPDSAVEAVKAKAESGEKIDVKAVKAEIEKAKAEAARLKAELDASKKQATQAYLSILDEKDRLAEELKSRPVIEKTVEKVVEKTVAVIPDGYSDEKAALEALKKKKDQAQREVSETYERKQRIQAELTELEARRRKYSDSEKEAKQHEAVLQELSRVLVHMKPDFDLFEEPPVPQMRNRWLDCATSLRIFADDIERWCDRDDARVIDIHQIEGAGCVKGGAHA